jgi:uncharacterized protein (DUF2141 family)
MKTVFITLNLLLSSLLLSAQSDGLSAELTDENSGTTISVTVPVPSDEGMVIIGLYDKDTFMKAGPLKGIEAQIIDGVAKATFTGVTPGTYAISLFHDKNGNKQMDFEPTGMPKEMYGVSNNPMSYGPPQWSEAKFDVGTSPIEMTIRL